MLVAHINDAGVKFFILMLLLLILYIFLIGVVQALFHYIVSAAVADVVVIDVVVVAAVVVSRKKCRSESQNVRLAFYFTCFSFCPFKKAFKDFLDYDCKEAFNF